MKCKEMAKTECSNHLNNRTCLGMWIKDTGEMVKFKDSGKVCELLMGNPCKCFEDTVLPMVSHTEIDKKRKEYEEAAEDYEIACCSKDKQIIRGCPDCGKPMPPKKRFCQACRNNRRKTSYRMSKSSNSTVIQNND